MSTQKSQPSTSTKQKKTSSVPNAHDIAAIILSKIPILCTGKRFYMYNEHTGTYISPDGGEFVKRLIGKETRRLKGPECTKHYVDEVLQEMADINYIEAYRFWQHEYELNVQNGILNIITGELQPHSPNKYFLYSIPVNYDPTKQYMPKIIEFFSEVVEVEHVEGLFEFFGYCLCPGYPIQKAFLLIGPPDTGKSTVLKLLRLFIGDSLVSSVSPQDLEEKQFAVSGLFCKFANINGDLPIKGFEDTAVFKQLTSGRDQVKAERKYEPEFYFVNQAKLIFACNKAPLVKYNDDGFFKRWIIIRFDKQIPPEKQDPNLLNKIVTPDELSALLNSCLKSLKDLLNRGSFKDSQSIDQVRKEYRQLTDSVYVFIDDYITFSGDDNSVVVKSELHKQYIDFCKINKLPYCNDKVFGRRIKGLLPGIKDAYRNHPIGSKDKKHVWVGIMVRDLDLVDDPENLNSRREESNELTAPKIDCSDSESIIGKSNIGSNEDIFIVKNNKENIIIGNENRELTAPLLPSDSGAVKGNRDLDIFEPVIKEKSPEGELRCSGKCFLCGESTLVANHDGVDLCKKCEAEMKKE
jgi:putative DNA primase/helicase